MWGPVLVGAITSSSYLEPQKDTSIVEHTSVGMVMCLEKIDSNN